MVNALLEHIQPVSSQINLSEVINKDIDCRSIIIEDAAGVNFLNNTQIAAHVEVDNITQ